MSSKSASKKQSPVKDREKALSEARAKQNIPDPLDPGNMKKMALRLGVPLVIGWLLVIFVLDHWVWKTIMGVLTAVIVGVTVWAINYAKKSKKVVDILKTADTAEGRKEAIEKLDASSKKGDAAAIFAKAQLEMQDDPRKALSTLEQINLAKVMAHVADEARAQRAMIHLILGETDEARSLVDGIDLSRHKESKSRATLTAIIGEAWARSGQARRAVDLLEKLDPHDDVYQDISPQLLRSRAFAYAFANNSKAMKSALHELKSLNIQYLMGFITKKKNPMGVSPRGVHPLLEKEAYDLVMRSGVVQRKMEMRRK